MRREYSVFTWPYLLLKDLEPVTSGNKIPEPGMAISKTKPIFLLRMSCPNQSQKSLKHLSPPVNSDRARNLKALKGDLSEV